MDFTYTEEHRSIIKLVRKFTTNEISPRAEEMDASGRLPDDLIQKLSQIGLLGMNLPEQYGGANATSLDCVLTIENMAASGTGAWWLPAFCNSIPECIHRFGTDPQKETCLPPIVRGEAYPSLQFTEADTGSDPDALKTVATRVDDDHFSISGMKRFSTFGNRPGFAVLFARHETGECSAFLVEKHTTGYTTAPDYELMGSGGMEACDVYYEKFNVGREQILGEPGKGMQVLQYWISYEKIQQCAACVGMAAAALSEAIAYAKERTVRGKPQSGLQGVRWMLAEMHAKLEAARYMTYRAASLKDRSAPNWIVEAASAKLFVVPTAMEIVEMSRRIHGPYGYTKGTTIERLYRAAAGASAIAVSLEINKSIVGAALLK